MKNEKVVSGEVVVSRIVDRYWRPFVALFLICLVAGAGYLGYSQWQSRREIAAQEKLFAIQKEIDKKSGELKKETSKNPQTLQAEFAPLLEQLSAFIKSHESLKAAQMAAIKKAELALEFKDLTLAENVLNLVKENSRSTDIFFGLVRSQLAAIYIDQGKFKEATTLLEEIVQVNELKYLHPHS